MIAIDHDFFGNVMNTRRNIGSRDGVSLINLKICVCGCVCGGGLGIIDLDTQNIYLFSKWPFKLVNEEGVWQEILRKKIFEE